MPHLRPTLALLLLTGLLAACTTTPVDPDDPGGPGPGPGPAPAPGTVTGRVLDTQGRPIPNATVWIRPALTTGLVETRTGADGRYTAAGLIDVPYYALAWTRVSYGGESYCLRLGMPNAADFDSFVPSEGAVRDFRWQLTGVIEDLRDYDGYFGGEVRLFRDGRLDGTVELTFTPTGPLVDGSTIAPFTRTLDMDAGLMLYDLPLGTYAVTGTLVGADGTRTGLRVGTESADFESQTVAADFAFASDGGCGNASGIARGFLYVNSPIPW